MSLSSENVSDNQLIDYGFLNFDNLGVGLIQVFRIVTLEGWSQIMYNYMDSVGLFSSLFFPLLVLVGSYFMLNLFLAVIMETFSEMTDLQKQFE